MDFKGFKQGVHRSFNETKGLSLFSTQIDKDEIWDVYLSAYPEGSDPIFRERSGHDCSACRSFVKRAGAIVAIVNEELVSLGDFEAEGEYRSVVQALSAYVKSKPIENVFLHTEPSIGTDRNRELVDAGAVLTWEHLHIALPQNLRCEGVELGPRLSEYRSQHDELRGKKRKRRTTSSS